MSWFLELVPLLVSVAALCLSAYVFLESRGRRRRKLVNAIYHHATRAIEDLETLKDRNDSIREKIEQDESYTPHVVRSTADDLTYDQVIEVMELLDEREEAVVLSYFHQEAELHAYAASFDLEFVRRWPSDRKLALWKAYEKSGKDTLESATNTARILEDHQFPGRAFRRVRQAFERIGRRSDGATRR